MKITYSFLVLLLFLPALVSGQQLPLVTQTDGAELFINPAQWNDGYLRYQQNTTVSALYRYQWAGLEDAPRTALATLEHFNEYNNVLISGSIVHDRTGPTGLNGIYGRFAYHIEMDEAWSALLGVSGGIAQYRVDAGELEFLEADDIAQNNASRLLPDIGIGATLYYRRSDRNFYLGVAVPQSLGFNLNYTTDQNDFSIRRLRHFHATGGAQFLLNDDSWLMASVWSKYIPNVPFHLDMNLRYEYRERFWLGFGGSLARALHLETGVIANPGYDWSYLRFGYAFNHFFSDFGPNFGSVHELKVSYTWDR